MNMNDGKPNVQWSPEELQVMEQFFDFRVTAPPYRPSSLAGFGRTLNLPPLVLKDAVQLMRLDLAPELMPGLKWHMHFCMRVPPSASPPIVPVGNPAVIMYREKILFFVSIQLIIRFFTFVHQMNFLFMTITAAIDKSTVFTWHGLERFCVIGDPVGARCDQEFNAIGEPARERIVTHCDRNK